MLNATYFGCTDLAYNPPGNFSCSRASGTKYPQSFIDAQNQSTRGNCDSSYVNGYESVILEENQALKKAHATKQASVLSFRVLFPSFSFIMYSIIVEIFASKRDTKNSIPQVTVTSLDRRSKFICVLCMLVGFALIIALCLVSISCFGTDYPASGFYVLLAVIPLYSSVFTILFTLIRRSVPESFVYPQKSIQNITSTSSRAEKIVAKLKENFDMGGKHEKAFLFFKEFFQVCMQVYLLAALCTTSDIVNVSMTTILIFFDLALLPFLLLSSRKAVWRDTVKFF
jgi:hypothetical protein